MDIFQILQEPRMCRDCWNLCEMGGWSSAHAEVLPSPPSWAPSKNMAHTWTTRTSPWGWSDVDIWGFLKWAYLKNMGLSMRMVWCWMIGGTVPLFYETTFCHLETGRTKLGVWHYITCFSMSLNNVTVTFLFWGTPPLTDSWFQNKSYTNWVATGACTCWVILMRGVCELYGMLQIK